mgnify:CR=1 FL=1
MAGQDDLGALLEEELDSGHGRADAGVVGDLLGVVERHVEVGPHEHLLPPQIRLPQRTHATHSSHCIPSPAPNTAPRASNEIPRSTQQSSAIGGWNSPSIGSDLIESAARGRRRRRFGLRCDAAMEEGGILYRIEGGNIRISASLACGAGRRGAQMAVGLVQVGFGLERG